MQKLPSISLSQWHRCILTNINWHVCQIWPAGPVILLDCNLLAGVWKSLVKHVKHFFFFCLFRGQGHNSRKMRMEVGELDPGQSPKEVLQKYLVIYVSRKRHHGRIWARKWGAQMSLGACTVRDRTGGQDCSHNRAMRRQLICLQVNIEESRGVGKSWVQAVWRSQ